MTNEPTRGADGESREAVDRLLAEAPDMQVVLDFFQGDAEFEAMVEPLKDWLNRLRAALAPFRTTEGGQA